MIKTYLIGVTEPLIRGVYDYLNDTGQMEFMDEFIQYGDSPLKLVSFYAKLCYKSLVLGKNENVSKIRSIEDNLIATFNSGHGSVFEHVWLNFVTTNCSRVFTHELVRHRVGTAFSQTSGRYVSIDELKLVLPPNIASDFEETRQYLEDKLKKLRDELIKPNMSFNEKKKLTSAIRRLAPNGQVNEIGWSCNVRSLRHMIEMRTSRHAEWEIRVVFNQVATIIKEHWPMMLYGCEEEEVDDLIEYRKLKV